MFSSAVCYFSCLLVCLSRHFRAKLAALNLLAAVCSDKSNADATRKAGLIVEFAKAIQAGHQPSIACSLATLSSLSESDANKDAIVEAGCKPPILSILFLIQQAYQLLFPFFQSKLEGPWTTCCV